HRDTRTYATIGYAVGSGGADESSVFRQTGLQDNNDKFGGVSSFRYYGELLEPELSNLEIKTAALGFRPLRATSVDLVAHSYRQRSVAGRIEGANLQTRPRGFSPDIGTEWDLIVALEELRMLELEYVFAWFFPGDAFASDATSARFHKLQIQLRF
ncbi:MAG: alginate export family protein, partial [Gemmatimonadetes bacterium]|nr:alginate export family protein [Gemmatimonadota bacterium]